jgi:carbohydrate-selective porin OprB
LLGGFLSFSTYAVLVNGTINKHFSIAGAFYDSAAAPGFYGVHGGIFKKWGLALDLGVSWNVKAEAERNGMVHISFLYTNKDPTDLDNPFLIRDAIKDALGGAPLPTADGNSLMNITFNQYLWKPKAKASDKKDDADKKKEAQTAAYGFNKRGVGLYARYAIGPDDRNVFNSFMSIGFGARGVSDKRPYDRMGIGMYFFKKSDALNSIPINLLGNETGLECYYSAAITPSIQLGADIQYVNSGITSIQDPFVAGLRLMIQL